VKSGFYGDASFTLVHAIPGRIRLRVERRDAAMLETAVAFLAGTPGVIAVRANRACRSIVVRYDERLGLEALLASIGGSGILLRVRREGAPAALAASQQPSRWMRLVEGVAFELVDVPAIGLVRDLIAAVRIVAAAWRERGERSWPEIISRAAAALLRECSVLDVFLPTPVRWLLGLFRAASCALKILGAVSREDGALLLPRAIGIARVALAA
jgi:hypothetical protein